MELSFEHYKLKNLTKYNVIMGKNGCGKSTLLRALDQHTAVPNTSYVSPERGGSVEFVPHIEAAVLQDSAYLKRDRNKNYDASFRHKTIVLLKNLELRITRSILADEKRRREGNETFQTTVDKINSLFDNVKMLTSDRIIPEFYLKHNNAPINSDELSSGEKELLALAVEIIHSSQLIATTQLEKPVMLLDEPDAHLHPDLQYRLIELLADCMSNLPITIIISTHSTAILSALSKHNASVCFMKKGDKELDFIPISEALKSVLPIFGAHPLSTVYSEIPLMIVEGEGDERIWQQVVKSSQGRIKIWPCEAGSISKMNEYETTASNLISSVYDNAKAYSLRDKDDAPDADINDLPNVIRFRLNCYAAENLLLSNDVLAHFSTSWDELKAKIVEWISSNDTHPRVEQVKEFTKTFDRQNHKIKDITYLLLFLMNANKPWEVIVGQAISRLNTTSPSDTNSLCNYLGTKIVQELQLRS